MRLEAYLRKRGESENAFAQRAGISQAVVNRVCRGIRCSLRNAGKIGAATGGKVAYEDLVGLAVRTDGQAT